MRSSRSLSVLLLGLACACDNEATVVQSSNCLEACLGASADFDFDLEGQLAVTGELRLSLEQARIGLAAYASVAQSLTGFVQSMVDLDPSMPDGLTYEGGGRYSVQPDAGTRVELSFYLPSNTSYGAAGDLIGFNLFNVSNYFASFGVKTSASVGLSGVSTSVSFTFDGTGPGAELLGIAAGAGSPIAVDVSGFSKRLSKVIVQANVSVQRASDNASIAFSISPTSRAIGTVVNATIPVSIRDFHGTGKSLDQVLTLSDSGLALRQSGSVFDGTLKFASVSSDIGFDMLFRYSASASADIVLGCTGAQLTFP